MSTENEGSMGAARTAEAVSIAVTVGSASGLRTITSHGKALAMHLDQASHEMIAALNGWKPNLKSPLDADIITFEHDLPHVWYKVGDNFEPDTEFKLPGLGDGEIACSDGQKMFSPSATLAHLPLLSGLDRYLLFFRQLYAAYPEYVVEVLHTQSSTNVEAGKASSFIDLRIGGM
jgi:hypothetical protein